MWKYFILSAPETSPALLKPCLESGNKKGNGHPKTPHSDWHIKNLLAFPMMSQTRSSSEPECYCLSIPSSMEKSLNCIWYFFVCLFEPFGICSILLMVCSLQHKGTPMESSRAEGNTQRFTDCHACLLFHYLPPLSCVTPVKAIIEWKEENASGGELELWQLPCLRSYLSASCCPERPLSLHFKEREGLHPCPGLPEPLISAVPCLCLTAQSLKFSPGSIRSLVKEAFMV